MKSSNGLDMRGLCTALAAVAFAFGLPVIGCAQSAPQYVYRVPVAGVKAVPKCQVAPIVLTAAGSHSISVPAGCVHLAFIIYGGIGGTSWDPNQPLATRYGAPSRGDGVSGTVAVRGGTSVQVVIGAKGADASVGCYQYGDGAAGRGGGGSVLLVDGQPVAVAAGGGGGGCHGISGRSRSVLGAAGMGGGGNGGNYNGGTAGYSFIAPSVVDGAWAHGDSSDPGHAFITLSAR